MQGREEDKGTVFLETGLRRQSVRRKTETGNCVCVCWGGGCVFPCLVGFIFFVLDFFSFFGFAIPDDLFEA